MSFVDYIYNIVKIEFIDMESVDGEDIVRLVGSYGFNALIDNDLLESCGVNSGHIYYSLVDRVEK